MKFPNFKSIGSISLSALLIASTFVIFNSSANASGSAPVDSGSSSDEVTAASGTNRFVVWKDAVGEGSGDIFLRRSTDNGATWKPSVNLSNNPGFSTSPMITVSGSKVYVVWVQFNTDVTQEDVFFRRSTDNGANWGPLVKITTGTNHCDGGCFHGLKVIGSASNVYAIWSGGSPGDIFLRRSSDSGASWKSIFSLSSNAGPSGNPQIAVSSSNVYVAWTQLNTAGTLSDIFVRRSTDGGATWKSKLNLSNDPEYSSNSQIAISGSNVYVVWNGEIIGDGHTFAGIKLKRSVNGGATWGAVQELSEPPTEQNGVLPEGAVNARIVVIGSNVYAAWNDNVISEDKSEDADIFFRRSTDGGSSWDPAISVGHENNNGCEFNLQLAASSSGVYLMWTIGACSDAGQIIFFSHSTNNGASWSAPDDMSDIFVRNSLGAQLAATGSTVFIVCAENMGGPGFDIFIARSTNSGATWPLATNLSKTSGVSDSPQIAL